MKMNYLKEEMRKKRKKLVMPPAPLIPAVTAHVKMTANTDHVGVKRNLNGMMTHYPALSISMSVTFMKMKVMNVTWKPKKKMVTTLG